MMMHTMERYFTKDDDMDLTTDLAEAVLRRMKTAVFAVLRNPEDYRQRVQIMWGGSVAHWGLTGCGISDDWITCKPNCPSGLSSHPGYRGREPALLPPQDDRRGRRWLRRSCFLYAS